MKKEPKKGGTYPEGFSFEKLKSLHSFKSRITYVDSYLPLLGEGSARRVYDANTIALKVARNEIGVHQNEIEAAVASSGYFEKYVATVYNYTDDFMCIEQEKSIRNPTAEEVRKFFGGLTEEEAHSLLVDTFFSERIPFQSHKNKNRDIPHPDVDWSRAFRGNKRLRDILELCFNYDLLPADLRAENLGVVKKGSKERVVLIDIGLTVKIFKEFYSY